MGRRQVKVIVVSKPVTFAFLVVTTAAMVGLIYGLSGRAYAADTHPVREIVSRLLGRGEFSRESLLAFLMPVIANMLLFVPWGFLLFLVLDSPSRARGRAYAITVVSAMVFAATMYVWQQLLPTHVTSLSDAFANAAGALAGAALGNARKSVRVRFDF